MARRSYNTGIKVWDMVLPKAYQDYEGNWYDAVILGDQVWLAENLHTKYYPDGTPITFGNNDTSDYSDQGRYYISESVVDNGYYYNISAVMNGASYTDAIPSGVQGIAMSGWHVPSKGEYEKLRIYLESNDEYVEIVGTTKKTAKAITSPYYWNETSTQGTPGYQSFNNNITGFNAVPSGNISVNSSGMHHYNLNQVVRFCTTSVVEMNPQNIFAAISSNSFYITTVNNQGTNGHSVRLVCDKKAKDFFKDYMDTYGGDHQVFEFLKFIALEDNVQIGVKSTSNSDSVVKSIQCSTDRGNTWTTYTTSTEPTYFGTFNTGDEILLRGTKFDNENTGMYYNSFVSTGGKWEASGNINSVRNWSNEVASQTYKQMFYMCSDLVNAPYLPCSGMTGTYSYSSMFGYCLSLKKSPKLTFVLPTANAYQGMFGNCTALVYAGEIGAVTHQYATCASMFQGCTSLKTSPYIYPGTLASTCFYQMFAYCSSLATIIFTLPSSTVANTAYERMFAYCTSLSSPPNLPATSVEYSAYMEMFMGCTSLVTPPSLPATTIDTYAYRGMFKGCTAMESAPSLPAQTMTTYCYGEMFQNCTALTTPPALPSTTLANSCYRDMFNGCTALTSAPYLPATTLEYYAYQSMFQNCSNLNYINAAFTTTPGTNYTQNWVQGVAASGTFVKNSEATWADTYGDHYIPTGWGVTDELRIQPLTFEATADNTVIRLRSSSSSFVRTIEYTTDGETWNSVSSTNNGTIISTLSNGQKIKLRGYNSAYAVYTQSPFSINHTTFQFSANSPCYVYGNIMSLIGDDYQTNKTITDFGFYGLFGWTNNAIQIKTNDNGTPLLSLPATSLGNSCYSEMFRSCVYMTKAPILSSTTLSSYCYSAMFIGCVSLTSTPYLPSETLVSGSYSQMFQNCTSLNEVRVNATSINASSCTNNWLSNVSSTGDFYYRNGVSWPVGANGIPSGWTGHVLA